MNWVRKELIELRAPNDCPYKLVNMSRPYGDYPHEEFLGAHECHRYRANNKWLEVVNRDIVLREGRVVERVDGGEQVLFDTNLSVPDEVKPPNWALEW